MLFRTTLFAVVIFGLILPTESRVRGIPYSYILEAENDILSGHISPNAEKGDKVLADVVVEETEGEGEGEATGTEENYLKIIIIKQSNQKVKTTPTAAHQTSRQQEPTTHEHPMMSSEHKQTFTSALTGSPEQTKTGSDSLFSPSVLPNQMITQEEVSVVTTKAKPGTHPQTGSSHSVHISGPHVPSTGSISPAFRNLHPHGHNIHITHLAKDSVHPVVNKRSVRGRKFNPRTKRNVRHVDFAVDPHDFQPEHLRVNPVPVIPELVVMDTDAFYVDPVDNFVKVNNTEQLTNGHLHIIEFYVYLADQNGEIISNPLPFLVYIERPEVSSSSSYPAVPAVFAGVLVLCVIFFAVAIPLVTRAKRRYKQGKPLFKLGSHPSRADLQSAEEENKSNMNRNPSEPNWYGNNYFYTYDDEVAKERSEFTSDLKHYTEKDPPTLQLNKKRKEPLSEKSSSSGVDVSSQDGANGVDGEDTYSQRL